MEKYQVEHNFLAEKKPIILDGLDYIEANIFRPNYLEALENMHWKCVIVPDEEWTPSKWFPTESSEENRETRFMRSYIDKNPTTFSYGDRFGWAYHELVHAAIFSGNFPRHYLAAVESPFGYPLNTDEIFCYGYQMMKLRELNKNGGLMRFAIGKIPGLKPRLCVLINAILKQ